MKDIFNDYYEDLKKYYRIIKKYVKKIFRTLRYYWNNPKSKFGKKIIPKLKDFYQYLKINFENIYLKSEYKKRNISITISCIILGLFLLIFPSFAFYQNSYKFELMQGIVGDMYSNQFDYSLLIYLEQSDLEGKGTGTYKLTSDIPIFGFAYSGYKCKNESILNYDEENLTTSVTLNEKDVCSIYFDLISNSDIGINIMLEETVASNSYQLANFIPYYGYKYSHYECNNNSLLTYDSNIHKVRVESSVKDNCNVYFKKEEHDVETRLFVEKTYQKKDYIERVNIPENKEYILGEESVCFNKNNERIEAEISYTDGYVLINSNSMAYCNVYLDLANE